MSRLPSKPVPNRLASLAAGAAFALGATFAAPALAEDFVIDSTHVHTAFSVSHLGFSRTVGQFDDVQGTFSFDQDDPASGSVEVTIQTASVDTAHDERDKHLRSADFFNVEEFPTMTFTSTAVETTGDNTGTITGDLTLLGVTKPVTLDVTFNQAGEHPMNQKFIAGFSATTSIKRSEFGMEYALPAVGDEVDIMIEVEGIRASDVEEDA